MGRPRVLVIHNRYRMPGGEERVVALHRAALARAGVEHAVLERDSGSVSSARAGRALVRGGLDEDEVARAVADLAADVVHCHNMLPLLGPRALTAARDAGARVVLHLHNYRLFCNVYAGFRDGAPCFRCRGRNTLPGLVLNCRGAVPESAAYAVGLARHQPRVFEAVESFATPSAAARDRLAWLGVPRDRIAVVPNYLPADELAAESRAGEGEYALAAGRVTVEKGFEAAVDAAALAGVPLRVAGDGPAMAALRQRAERGDARVELLGRVDAPTMADLRARAAMVVVPSLWEETFGLVALEAMGSGVPVAAFAIGALPEVAGAPACVAPADTRALAARMRTLWEDRAARQAEGEAALARAREHFPEERFTRAVMELYAAS
ncbi:MAG TPA: glycosyltransferase family 4 protein [Thermoleophilaceae bacterium]|nr:glycosyltransferase family 4 protein [Thermoleophilaceae bacterium]